ncbi:hypothetical protein IMG5_023120, partial [Ichthyophthirius multifiliis]
MDCGLIPDQKAIINMYIALETDKNIGGVCGFMGIKFQDVYSEAIIRTQMYEYNMGHMLDKPFESLFGYIQVLPGAFSGYRWDALKRDDDGECILDEYLISELDPDIILTLEQKNMFLAEDRILCLKIFSKRKKAYTLRYLPNAKARVDPITHLMALVGQRRRWINGSYFALKKLLKNQAMTYISVALFFVIVFIMVMTSVTQVTLSGYQQGHDPIFQIFGTTVFITLYIMSILGIMFYSISFNNQNHQVQRNFYKISTFLGIIMIVAVCLMTYYIIEIAYYMVQKYLLHASITELSNIGILTEWEDGILKTIFCGLVVFGFLLNLVPILIYPTRILETMKCTFDFIAYQATYVHLLLVYAICRIDDLSWGTKNT